ncbi:hypothetical protein [Colwellia sp. MEBiC06753]
MTKQLGPITQATLVSNDIEQAIEAYQTALKFTLISRTQLSSEQAQAYQANNLINANVALLAAANGNAWLRIIEDKSAATPTPLTHLGWLALEVNVADVDAVYQCLCQHNAFTIISPPAYLELSDKIKACQVAGPCGEVLYITEIQGQVPPFELPETSAFTGDLFIPVLATTSREKSLQFYENLNQHSGLSFDTKITALNKTWGFDINHQYPVATLQLNGNALFEIDEVSKATPKVVGDGFLPAGIAMISCFVQSLEQLAVAPNDIFSIAQARHCVLYGEAGELIELIEQQNS